MATMTLATVDNLLKVIYEPKLRDQLQSDVKALRRIEKNSEGVQSDAVGGKYVSFGVRTRRNHGMGSRLESEALPPARQQKYEATQVKLKYQYGSIELTGPVFELADSKPQAFASALDEEMKGLTEGLTKDQNRQVFGTSAGKLATANAVGTTTTFVCTDNEAKYLEEGMFVDIFTSVDGVRVADVEITAISSAAGTTTVTFTPAAGANTASGDYITRDNSRNKEKIGFQEMVAATGILHNLDPTTVGIWKSVVNANGGTNRALSEGLLIKLVHDIKTKSGKTPSVFFTSLGVFRSYFALLVQQRRYTGTTEFTGGFSGLAFTTDEGEIPFVSDVDCQGNRVYAINEGEIELLQSGDWSWMDRDGSKWQRVITSAGTFDAYAATTYKYSEMATHQRNSHGLLSDLIEG